MRNIILEESYAKCDREGIWDMESEYGIRLSHILEIPSISNEKPSISIEIPSISIKNLGFRSKY